MARFLAEKDNPRADVVLEGAGRSRVRGFITCGVIPTERARMPIRRGSTTTVFIPRALAATMSWAAINEVALGL